MSLSLSKKAFGFPLAIIIVLVGVLLPATEGLAHEGILALSVLFATVVLLICETLPMGVTGLLALVVAAILGIAPIGGVFSGFGTTTVIFAIAVFSLTAIVMKSDLAIRLTVFMVRIAGAKSSRLVLAFMIAGGLLSAIMNDSATLVLFLGFSDTVLEHAGHEKGKSRLAKCLYLGSAFAVFMGGMATPAGSSLNVLGLGLVEQITGQSISFLGWTIAAAPVAILMIPVCWLAVIKIFKPEPISTESLASFVERANGLGRLSAEEIKTLILIVGIPVLWILGTWIPILNVTTVSVVGLALMCAPGMNLLTFEEFQKSVPWTIVIMIGAVLSIGGFVGATGGVAYFGELFLNSGIMALGVFLTFLIITAVIYFVHSVVPVGPAFATILIPPLMAYCIAAGYSPAIPAIILPCILSGNMLFPMNPGLALSYKDNVYRFGEVFKAGIGPVMVLVVLLALWVPFATSALGIAL
ncbi:MAG: SLC13 family permease [Coriobacteriia bacterium]|nr:SLC13 family permease [Coriobacteriia bacterium]